MLFIWCENKEQKELCAKGICCCECDKENCFNRCNKKLVEECEDFNEDID